MKPGHLYLFVITVILMVRYNCLWGVHEPLLDCRIVLGKGICRLDHLQRNDSLVATCVARDGSYSSLVKEYEKCGGGRRDSYFDVLLLKKEKC